MVTRRRPHSRRVGLGDTDNVTNGWHGSGSMVQRVWLSVLATVGVLICRGAGATDFGLSDLGIEVHGFGEVRAGMRTRDDAHEPDRTLSEARLQLELRRDDGFAIWQVRADFLHDQEAEDTNVDLDTGKGPVDLREANVMFSPAYFMDVKLGRQILTWGTGDLIFLNDLFPKDWQSFLLGRDRDYLKAPSDAVKVSLFPEWASIDIVYTPQFDPDRYVRGERLSYWDPMTQAVVGQNRVARVDTPDEWFDDDEWAARMSRTLGSYEVALYGYDGFWKSPAGFDPVSAQATFPKLRAYGASVRGTLGDGIANAEVAYYGSRDDRDGDDPFVPNSEWRFLLGYERELGRDLTGAVQYYVEWMQDYDAYTQALAPGVEGKEEARHDVSLRLTKLLLNQDLTLSLYIRYSITDNDCHIRPTCDYSISDNWTVSGGANIFAGENDYTFLGQFENNSNVFAALRYSF
jgi:hypothetical protein